MSFDLETLFGKSVQTKDGKRITPNDIKAKHLGIYFSAHWCPPCRGFTPVLAQFYEECKKKYGDRLEVIFVSSDRDQTSFDEYYEKMPWLCLPFEDRDTKEKLATTYGVRGIPTLVILNRETGTVHIANARTVVAQEGALEKFNWIS